MAHKDKIRRRPDGSVDTSHYMTVGRQLRSDAIRDMVPFTSAERTRRKKMRRQEIETIF